MHSNKPSSIILEFRLLTMTHDAAAALRDAISKNKMENIRLALDLALDHFALDGCGSALFHTSILIRHLERHLIINFINCQ